MIHLDCSITLLPPHTHTNPHQHTHTPSPVHTQPHHLPNNTHIHTNLWRTCDGKPPSKHAHKPTLVNPSHRRHVLPAGTATHVPTGAPHHKTHQRCVVHAVDHNCLILARPLCNPPQAGLQHVMPVEELLFSWRLQPYLELKYEPYSPLITWERKGRPVS